jgi:hypothetical protein
MLPPKDSLKILMKLMKILAPSMAAMADGSKGDVKTILDQEISKGMLAGAATELCARLDEDEIMKIVEKFGEYSEADGVRLKAGHFAVHFSGKIGRMMKWLVFCVKVQYEDFLGELGLGLS